MIHDEAIKRMFMEYEQAFRELDIEKGARFFADTFLSAGPRGTITQSKAEYLQKASLAADFYRQVGQTSARIITADETPISANYSWVKVLWGVTFRKTGNKLVEFDVSYFIQNTGDEPRIIMFIAHQDEEQAMKELGVLPREKVAA